MKSEYTEIIDLGFSVTDAEESTLEYNRDSLKVSFLDWRETAFCQPVMLGVRRMKNESRQDPL
jgi:hypothetical protein